jgi:hypothetical protein
MGKTFDKHGASKNNLAQDTREKKEEQRKINNKLFHWPCRMTQNKNRQNRWTMIQSLVGRRAIQYLGSVSSI